MSELPLAAPTSSLSLLLPWEYLPSAPRCTPMRMTVYGQFRFLSRAQLWNAMESVKRGEICFYHNSNLGGSVSDFFSDVKDHGTSQPGCYEFKGSGEGQGECMDHNVASVWNRTGERVSIYKDSECRGDHAVIAEDEIPQNLNDFIKNKNASHCIAAG